ncbi:MAG: aminotransferase class V-fold PLP-dependent enzyme, partial [Eubacteriales bacterium]
LDNLFEPAEILDQSQNEMARDIGAEKLFYTVGGSSSGVLAMLSLFRGKKVLMARDFHMSAAHAIELFDIQPIFIYPESPAISGVISAKAVKSILESEADIAAVYLTYPNYYGFCVDLCAITKIAHKKKIPVLVDGAHSACFPYSDFLPTSPAEAGVDAWVVSTHKTLPAMNQSGYVAVGKQSLISTESVKEVLNHFVTTSPSYPILASIDFAKDYMAKRGRRKIEKLFYAIVEYSKKIDDLPGFNVIKQAQKNEPKDILKWVIDFSGGGWRATEIKKALHKKRIYAEMIDSQVMLFLLSSADRKKSLKKVYRVLKKQSVTGKTVKEETKPLIEEAIWGKPVSEETVWIDLANSAGKTAAKAVAVYPPGVPVILKGQKITSSVIDGIKLARYEGLALVGLKEALIKVYADK